VLASNLANVDTPNFKPSDMRFEGFLKEATGADAASQHRAMADSAEIVTDKDAPGGLDGNAVDLDQTVANITENSVRYNTALELIRRKLALMSYAASGQ